MPNRALVTVVRSTEDSALSRAMVMGVVIPEMKRLQAERDLLAWGRNRNMAAEIAEIRRKYAVKPVSGMRRRFEQAMGLMVLLTQWRKEQKQVRA